MSYFKLDLITKKLSRSHNAILFLVICILIYFIVKPWHLKYFFENTLGRILLVLFLIAITQTNPMLGIMSSLVIIGLYNTRVVGQEGFENNDADKKEDKKEDKKTVSPSQVSPDNLVKPVTSNSNGAIVYPSEHTTNNFDEDNSSSSVSTPLRVQVEDVDTNKMVDGTVTETSSSTVEGFSNMGKQKNTMNAMLNTYKQMIPKQSNSLVFYKMPGSKETTAFEGFLNSTTTQY